MRKKRLRAGGAGELLQDVGLFGGGDLKAKGVKLYAVFFLIAKPLGLIPKTLGNVEDLPGLQLQRLLLSTDHSAAFGQTSEIMPGYGALGAICEMIIGKSENIKEETVAEIHLIQTASPLIRGEYYLIFFSIVY